MPGNINSLPAKTQGSGAGRPTGPCLADLAGMAEARRWGEAVARDIALYREGKLAWKDIDPACLLHGPPGTGKTTYAKALAATCALPLVATSYAIWQGADEGHLRTTIAAMQAAFADAKKAAPCVFFIDELDSIPKRGTGGLAAYMNALVNALLKAFDDVADMKGVIIVGACNHPDMLDPALVRSGRMDRMIAITLPSVAELEGILKFHLTDAERQTLLCPYSDCDTLANIALLCAGMTGADVAKTVRTARAHARNAGTYLSEASFREALDPADKRPDPETRRRIALHEAGHVVAGLRLAVSAEITASIISQDSSYGRIALRPADRPLTQSRINDLIVTTLAGRAAEEILLGAASALSGGDSTESDLARATQLAADAVLKLGYSVHGRLLWHAAPRNESTLLAVGAFSGEIRTMLDTAYDRAKQLITTDSRRVAMLAAMLMERRALSHADIMGIVEGRTGHARNSLRAPDDPSPRLAPSDYFVAIPGDWYPLPNSDAGYPDRGYAEAFDAVECPYESPPTGYLGRRSSIFGARSRRVTELDLRRITPEERCHRRVAAARSLAPPRRS